MRTLLCATLIPAAVLLAATLPAAAQRVIAKETEALLVHDDDSYEDIWISIATSTAIRYYENKVDTEPTDMKIAQAKSLYLKEPKEFSEAMDLFQARKYAEAKAKFAACKDLFKATEAMPGNFSAQGEFYEMECMRKTGDLEGINTLMQRFKPDPLPREDQRLQVELYTLWDAVRTKGWQRIETMAADWKARPLPLNLRTQIAYCLGLALEGLKKPAEALNAYSAALVADNGASVELVKPAALNILRIHRADPEVQKAVSRWGKEDEVKHAAGRLRLLEASAVAHFYLKFIGSELPPEYRDLLKYKEEEDKAGAPAAD
jgi:hypothetical protein